MKRTAASLLTLTCACGLFSRDLSRERAAELIQAQLEKNTFNQGTLAYDQSASISAALDSGSLEGLWKSPQIAAFGPAVHLELTEKGRAYFADVSVGVVGLRLQSSVTPKRRINSVLIGVTGISKPSEDARSAEFTWKLDADPIALRYMGLRRGEMAGTASFERYDDGWRVTGLSTSNRDMLALFSNDPAAEAAGRAARAEEQRRTQEAQLLREERWKQATTATTVDHTFTYTHFQSGGGFGIDANVTSTLEISGSGFKLLEHTAKRTGGSKRKSNFYGWWEVSGISASTGVIEISITQQNRITHLSSDFVVSILDDASADSAMPVGFDELTAAFEKWRSTYPEFAKERLLK